LNGFADEQLMQQVGAGDTQALALLYERHHRKVYAFFVKMVRQPDLAEDLTQDVFFRLLRYGHSFQTDTPFQAWLFRVAHNVANDHFQKHKYEVDACETPETEDQHDPNERLDQRQKLQRVERALGQLSHEKRELLILSRFHNLKYQQIANLFDCSVSAVKVRIHRALADLRKLTQVTDKEFDHERC
jgi:RNA polymerase sigma-70 factor (ECF subfamily)